MADFRKLLLALTATAVFAVTASAQTVPTTFSCVGNPTTNNQLRGGGITELVGDVLLTCGGGAVGTVEVAVAVQVQGGATGITNRLGTLKPGVGYPISAGLVVADISGNTLQLVQGYLQAASQNIVVFPGVVLPTGTTGTTVRISNIRVATNPVTSTATAIPVYATVSTTPAPFPITTPLQQVATVYPALKFSATDCAGGTAPSLSFRQCISEPRSGPGSLSFGIRFEEQTVASAFKTRVEENGITFPAAPGTFTYNGTYTPGTVIPGWSDQADKATRLIAVFPNIPTGVQLKVTAMETHATGYNGTTIPHAKLITGADVNGNGGSDAVGGTAATCSGSGVGIAGDTAVTNGLVTADHSGSTWYAVWEITQDDQKNFDQLEFGVQVSYTADPGAGTPALSTDQAKVQGQFAPLSAITIADATSAIPRFVNNPLESGLSLAIVPCVTNLLFPYATNQQGFNTGLAISNTSKDNAMTGSATAAPFNTSSQTGPCTLYFFGDTAPDPVTTKDVEPGTVWQDHLGNLAPSFQGYVIARCNFQYAHGLAFIITGGGSPSAYLALVIPDIAYSTERNPSPFPISGIGTGEQLGN